MNHKDITDMSEPTCKEITVAIIFPPAAVYQIEGKCAGSFPVFACTVLTCIGWIPGCVYALYLLYQGEK